MLRFRSLSVLALSKIGLFCLPLMFACNEYSSNEPDYRKDEKQHNVTPIIVDPDDTARVHVRDIFDSVTYIPLETVPESKFSKISKLEITDEHFIILDKATNSILFFNKQGKFSHRIFSRNSKGEVLYKRIGDFALDRMKSELVIFDLYSTDLTYVDLGGNKLRKSHCPDFLAEFAIKGGNYYTYKRYANTLGRSGHKHHDLDHNVVITNNNFSVQKSSLIAYDPNKLRREDLYDVNQVFFSSGDTSVFFVQPFNYNVYELRGEDVYQVYKLQLPVKNSLPDGFLSDDRFTNKRVRYVSNSTNKRRVWAYTDFYRTRGGYVTFNLEFGGNAVNRVCLYNLENRSFFNFENVYSDTLNWLMPIVDDQILGSDGISLYGSIPSKLMFTAIMQLGVSHISRNKTLINYYNESSVLSNPVISKMSLKKRN